MVKALIGGIVGFVAGNVTGSIWTSKKYDKDPMAVIKDFPTDAKNRADEVKKGVDKAVEKAKAKKAAKKAEKVTDDQGEGEYRDITPEPAPAN